MPLVPLVPPGNHLGGGGHESTPNSDVHGPIQLHAQTLEEPIPAFAENKPFFEESTRSTAMGDDLQTQVEYDTIQNGRVHPSSAL